MNIASTSVNSAIDNILFEVSIYDSALFPTQLQSTGSDSDPLQS